MMGSFMAMNTHARYYWNGENRMVRMEAKSTITNELPMAITFVYDHMGRCVSRNDEHFVWDGYNIVAEVADSSNVVYNTWGLDLDGTFQGLGGVGGLLSVDHGGRLSLPTYDANGNVTEYVGLDDGAVLSHSEYSAFGGVLRRNGAAAFSHGFSTKPSDAEGIVRYQFRRYYVGIGRWSSRDQAFEEDSTGIYDFVVNDPIKYTDVLGLTVCYRWMLISFYSGQKRKDERNSWNKSDLTEMDAATGLDGWEYKDGKAQKTGSSRGRDGYAYAPGTQMTVFRGSSFSYVPVYLQYTFFQKIVILSYEEFKKGE